MPEPWLLVDEVPESGGPVPLPPGEARHALAVLRLADGAPVVVADGRGRTGRGALRRAGRGAAAVEVVRVTRHPEPGPGVTVALGVLHTRAMDWAVQKAVEVGAARLVPVLSERAQLGAPAARGRLGHWRRVARQALKQCRRPWAMEVAEPATLDALLAGGPGIVADAGGAAPAELGVRLPVTLLVGPEGGLAPAELGALEGAGWRRVRLAPHTLRAETAAVVGAAVLAALHG